VADGGAGAAARPDATRSCRFAEQVHDWLGRLLASVVFDAAKLTNGDKKEIR
jgi:hypothetical protein